MNRTSAKRIAAGAVLILLIVLCALLFVSTTGKTVYPKLFSEYVDKYSEMYGVEDDLVYAVIKTESSFDSNARSGVGAIGLMQIMPNTFKWLQSKMPDNGPKMSAQELYSPETNIKYGTFFLSLLKKEFGSDRLAIAAYHAGRGQVNKWLKDRNISTDGETIEKIPSKSTGHYVDKVMKNVRRYRKLYEERG